MQIIISITGIIIGFIAGVILSEIVFDLTSESLLYYMLLPFAWVLKQLKYLFSPFVHPKLSWWCIKHGVSPYAKLDKFYELNDDDWNELMDKFCKHRSNLDRSRDRYLEQKEK